MMQHAKGDFTIFNLKSVCFVGYEGNWKGQTMKNALIFMALLTLTGISSAAMVNNPETFDNDGVLPAGWEAWGSGSGAAGWQGNGNGWTVSGGELTLSPEPSWTNSGLRMVFNHGNELAALPVGTAAAGTADFRCYQRYFRWSR